MSDTNVVKLAGRKAEEAGSSVSNFVRDHPGAVVAGGVAIGILASAFLARGSARKIAKHALTLAEIAGTAGLALSRDARDRAGEAGESLLEQGKGLAEKAGKLAEPAEEALDTASEAAQRLLRKAIDLAGKLRS